MKCLITGASKGIGRAIAVKLAECSEIDVILAYNQDHDGAKETAESIRALGSTAPIMQADLSTARRPEIDFRDTWAIGGIDVLVNNAGVTKDGLVSNG